MEIVSCDIYILDIKMATRFLNGFQLIFEKLVPTDDAFENYMKENMGPIFLSL